MPDNQDSRTIDVPTQSQTPGDPPLSQICSVDGPGKMMASGRAALTRRGVGRFPRSRSSVPEFGPVVGDA